MSPADLGALGAHLGEETTALCAALDAAGDEAYALPTPSPGWTVADQMSHLAYFDEVATTSVLDPVAFSSMRDEADRLGASLPDEVAARYRDRSPDELRRWFNAARGSMVDAMLAAGPSLRVPWYGPDYSVASAMTGRIMETWAHGQDVFDALGVAHPSTRALHDVARLCARTRANSYVTHGRVLPDEEVAVELHAPDGTTWTFGEGTSAVRGDAVEFCLVATQRLHVADTSLEADGPAAQEWLELAQAFAGPPGSGRARRSS
jgi:uncharacterized protein (TIGR03084 family)